MRTAKIFGVASALVIAAALGWRWMRSDGGATSDKTPRTSEPPPPESTTHAAAKGKPGRAPPRRLAPDARQRLLGAIAAQRQRRLATERSREAGAPRRPEDPGILDKDYIRERMADIMPLVKECYDNALHDNPTLAGTLVVEFTISGEAGVGAIIENSKVVESSTIDNASLRACVQETMYALEMRAPDEGGRFVVRYPFDFEIHDDPSEASCTVYEVSDVLRADPYTYERCVLEAPVGACTEQPVLAGWSPVPCWYVCDGSTPEAGGCPNRWRIRTCGDASCAYEASFWASECESCDPSLCDCPSW